MKPIKMQYLINLNDFVNDEQVLRTIRQVLKLNRSDEFLDSMTNNKTVYQVDGKNYEILISQCDCEEDKDEEEKD